MNTDELQKHLIEIDLREYLKVVGNSAQQRFLDMKQTTSKASYMNDIAGSCRRFLKLLRS